MSNDEYQHQTYWQSTITEQNGWVTVTMPDGQKITFNQNFWNKILYGNTK